MGYGKPDNGYKQVKRPYCPFKNFCIFLNGQVPETIIAERNYLSKRVDELEFAMDIGNYQALKLQERIKELEDVNSRLKTELSDALKDPFTKYERKETTETTKKLGAPAGHPGWFRRKPEQADKTIDVYLDRCATVKTFRHAITRLNISRKTLRTASLPRHVLFTVITGVPIAGRLFMAGAQMKFPMPLSGRMPEPRRLFCAMRSRLLMTMFNGHCNIFAD